MTSLFQTIDADTWERLEWWERAWILATIALFVLYVAAGTDIYWMAGRITACILTAWVAQWKQRSVIAWAGLAFVFSVIVVLPLLVMPRLEEEEEKSERTSG